LEIQYNTIAMLIAASIRLCFRHLEAVPAALFIFYLTALASVTIHPHFFQKINPFL
jgi:hypothetical protein